MITDEQIESMVRNSVQSEVRAAIPELRPLIRKEILEEMKWVSAETGILLLEIHGKDPRRRFKRLMSKWGVDYVKLHPGQIRYRRSSLEQILEKRALPSHAKRHRAGAGKIAAFQPREERDAA